MLLSLVPSNDLVRVGCGGGVSYRKRTTRSQSAYCAAQRNAMQRSTAPHGPPEHALLSPQQCVPVPLSKQQPTGRQSSMYTGLPLKRSMESCTSRPALPLHLPPPYEPH